MKPALVDTSTWIFHFQGKSDKLQDVLETQLVVTHDFVIGELSLGHFAPSQKDRIFQLLLALRQVTLSSHAEVLDFTRKFKLAGKGIGWVDAHILHACYSQDLQLVSDDRRLAAVAKQLL